MHGFGDLQPELTRLTREGRWADMSALIGQDLFDAMVAVGDPEAVGREVATVWGDVYERMTLYVNYEIDPDVLTETADAVRHAKL